MKIRPERDSSRGRPQACPSTRECACRCPFPRLEKKTQGSLSANFKKAEKLPLFAKVGYEPSWVILRCVLLILPNHPVECEIRIPRKKSGSLFIALPMRSCEKQFPSLSRREGYAHSQQNVTSPFSTEQLTPLSQEGPFAILYATKSHLKGVPLSMSLAATLPKTLSKYLG